MAALPRPRLTSPSSLLALGEKLLTFSLGGGAGLLVGTFGLMIEPDLLPGGWDQSSFLGACAGAGVVVERFLHVSVGPFLDPWLKDIAAALATRRKLAKLRRYEASGALPEHEVRKIQIRIAKQDINGGPRVTNRPSTYQKRGMPISPDPSPAPTTPLAANRQAGEP